MQHRRQDSAWQVISAADGKWFFSPSLACEIVKSHARAMCINDYSRRVVATERKWWNPFDDDLPDFVSVEVDWDRVNADADTIARLEYDNLVKPPYESFRWRQDYLRDLHEETIWCKRNFLERCQDARRETLGRMNDSISKFKEAEAAAKAIRDGAADTLMVGAVVLSGGAATAVLAGGATLKGTATYQDTGSVGAATMEATGAVVFHVIGVNEWIKSDSVIVIMKGAWKTSTCLVAGDDWSKALKAGGIEIAGEAIGDVIKSDAVADKLQRLAIPGTGKLVQVVSTPLGRESGGAVASKGTKYTLEKALADGPTPTARSAPTAKAGSGVSRAVFHDRMRLDLALFNEQEGFPAAYLFPFLRPR